MPLGFGNDFFLHRGYLWFYRRRRRVSSISRDCDIALRLTGGTTGVENVKVGVRDILDVDIVVIFVVLVELFVPPRRSRDFGVPGRR